MKTRMSSCTVVCKSTELINPSDILVETTEKSLRSQFFGKFNRDQFDFVDKQFF